MGLLDAARDVRTIKRLLTRAEAEARRDGEERHGPEHLLLAATELPDGTAARALAQVGVAPRALRDALAGVHDAALAGVGVGGEHLPGTTGLQAPATGALRSTPQAQQVFTEAAALAKASTPPLLRGAHVLAAACSLERGTVARALAALGVDREQLRTAARAEAG